jgi:hypothetical protein
MNDDLARLLQEIERVLPESHFEPVSSSKLAAIRQKYPDVPEHYLSFLAHIGYGALGDGLFAIYSGLCEPSSLFDKKTTEGLAGILFFGDDFAGWLVGFDSRNGWQIVGVDSAWPKPAEQEERTLATFIARRVEECEVAKPGTPPE